MGTTRNQNYPIPELIYIIKKKSLFSNTAFSHALGAIEVLERKPFLETSRGVSRSL